MKLIKRIVVGLLAIVGILLIVALFVPKDFQSERSVVIDRPRQEVYDYIKYLKNQDNYGVWQLSDPQMKKSFDGVDGTVGFRYSWESNKVGKGSQTITLLKDGTTMETSLDFGFGQPATAYFSLSDVGTAQTKVVWGIRGTTPYPWNLVGLFFDMGKDFDEGLQNLKRILEAP